MVAILVIVSLYVFLYVALSMPPIQNAIRDKAVDELSDFLDCKVEVNDLSVAPFNNVVINGLSVYDKQDRVALYVEHLGAGVNLWRLLVSRHLEFTYAELIGMRAAIIQDKKGEPLNIQFIIDAFKPKDKNKPPTKFDFALRNVVIRKSSVSFDRQWIPALKDEERIDFNHLRIEDFKADISLPQMKNDDFTINLRRLAFRETSGFTLDALKANAHITARDLSIKDFELRLPGTRISIDSLALQYDGFNSISKVLDTNDLSLNIDECRITPSDFAAFLPQLSTVDKPLYLTLDVDGGRSRVSLRELRITSADNWLYADIKGEASGLDKIKDKLPTLDFSTFKVLVDADVVGKVLTPLLNNKQIAAIAPQLGRVLIDMPFELKDDKLSVDGSIKTGLGDLAIDATLGLRERKPIAFVGSASTEALNVGAILPNIGLGYIAFDADADLKFDNKNVSGGADIDIPYVDYRGVRYTSIQLSADKTASELDGTFSIASVGAMADGSINLQLPGKDRLGRLVANLNVDDLDLGAIIPNLPLRRFAGRMAADVTGRNIDDMDGYFAAYDVDLTSAKGRELTIRNINLMSSSTDQVRTISFDSDYAEAWLKGEYKLSLLPEIVKNLISGAMPTFIKAVPGRYEGSYAQGKLRLKPDNTLASYFNLPVKLLTDATADFSFDTDAGKLNFVFNSPYLQQGRDKLIQNTNLTLNVSVPDDKYEVHASSVMPVKNKDMAIDLTVNLLDNKADADISWLVNRAESYRGKVSLSALLGKFSSSSPFVNLDIKPSDFDINDTTWHVSPARINYEDKRLNIHDLKIGHDNNYVAISGAASQASTDTLHISLSDINLDYVFRSLAINYVNFGGYATGNFAATSLFSGMPRAFTPGLSVKGFSYNGGVLGDAIIRSRWNAEKQAVEIDADVDDNGQRVAQIAGGVWVMRDSLGFNFNTDKVNIKFLKPFMSGFTEDVEGRATGSVNLYGTFKDINLRGRVYADTIRMKIGFTNVWYGGSDSVIIDPGKIIIPHFRLYATGGGSAILSGTLTHDYFHLPRFNFKISDARDLLVFNTNASINPDWYGKIYGSGSASVNGYPGRVNLDVDMSTAPKSVFTLVLSDKEVAQNYTFLTFSDKRREHAEQLHRPIFTPRDSVPYAVTQFRDSISRAKHTDADTPTVFAMDLRGTVLPNADFTLVMDPEAGDRIKARGDGSLRLAYDTGDDLLSIYGKYTITQGSYNFSLQDLILRNFIIRDGSSISFNGDPYQAMLNINAAYRVNASLSDLDKSFATDKDFNRTSVPVEAVLKVTGDLRSPDIDFDIDLPTLNPEAIRKVRSIISTSDMMSLQIAYLLAMNRFYTPQYMTDARSGGEFASLASTTISSHLANIFSSIAPGSAWNLSPNLRSDRDDFSNLEFDIALSGGLLSNRLLFNGNFGYRDRTTSSTTFIGDFDVEYLLNRSGSLRLKAYNHYNDQNKYLRSALTTQGLGIEYKHHFNNWFSFLRKKKKKTE
jgi:hypothetical protein